MNNLNLYAKIEPYIGFDEEYKKLYEIYLKEIKKLDTDIKTVLDIGCGNGNFLLMLQKLYDATGIDISYEMVKIATKKGANAYHKPIEDVKNRYDLLLAVSDVLNYLDKNSLKKFLFHVNKKVNQGGFFICDINTLYGFEEITAGSLIIDNDDKFIAIDSIFEENMLLTYFTLFQKNNDCYKKESEEIKQFYHTKEEIEKLISLKLIKVQNISLFGEENDKSLLIFKKV